MGRVEWSALSGDEVEAVLSNLLYNAPMSGRYGSGRRRVTSAST